MCCPSRTAPEVHAVGIAELLSVSRSIYDAAGVKTVLALILVPHVRTPLPTFDDKATPLLKLPSLGVTLDPCDGGLKIITIDRTGALGRTGRVVNCPPLLAAAALWPWEGTQLI